MTRCAQSRGCRGREPRLHQPFSRGGEVDETLVRFDGLRLFNPFHFKDFLSIFSTIDPAIIREIEVYTGAFPAAFGDRMSGVINIESLPGANESKASWH